MNKNHLKDKEETFSLIIKLTKNSAMLYVKSSSIRFGRVPYIFLKLIIVSLGPTTHARMYQVETK